MFTRFFRVLGPTWFAPKRSEWLDRASTINLLSYKRVISTLGKSMQTANILLEIRCNFVAEIDNDAECIQCNIERRDYLHPWWGMYGHE